MGYNLKNANPRKLNMLGICDAFFQLMYGFRS